MINDKQLDIIKGAISKARVACSINDSISLKDSIDDAKDSLIELANKSSAFIKDGYGNSLAAIGNNDKVQNFTNYNFTNSTLDWCLWMSLYNDSWVFRKAVDRPAQDQVKCGFTLYGDQDFTKVYKAYDKYKQNIIELLTWGALFGGSVAVMMFDTIKTEEMLMPLNKQKIKGARMKLYVTDRWYGVSCDNSETVTNMADVDFGKPKYYTITFANGGTATVHHSYILRYEHRIAPKLIKNGQLQGWGYAEGSHIIRELMRDDQLKSSVTSLVNKSLIEVIKMAGMRGVFMGTDKGNEEQLTKRLEMVNWGRTYNSLTFLDKDDEYAQYSLSGIEGLANLIDKEMWMVAAAVDMPGILFGELKGGLATDSNALENYSDTIKTKCEAYLRPVLTKFLKVLYIMYDIKANVDFDFNSLRKKEENNEKVQSINALTDVIMKLNNSGFISKYQGVLTLQNYMNKDIISIDISDDQLNKLKLEEQQDILDTIERLSKKKSKQQEIITSQFPNPEYGHDVETGNEDIEEEESVESEEEIEPSKENIEEVEENAVQE